ncbi:sacsin N-terminal ATP-binding-like domain-containing protein [Cesiribacter sp. SM1]|uniref:sacsin N-terminal ATP-binding-like domain-containing protein n=1 Tax=Cesiribacter sp. SM1 TaxID=2861196 RepID=UPI001CD751F0|nr:hypothetical protein [Cesiribacter sp. SM1]
MSILSPSQVDPEDPKYIEERNNRKLTADKIRQILSKVRNNPSSSSKRWAWELMQNAKDVPNTKFERVSIKIILSDDNLVFQHNGDAFSLSNIFSLIQQVSSKDSTNSDEKVTGKFGTGFISTHLLSEVIDVRGVVRHKGIYRRFETRLDREGNSSEELLPKIDEALEHIRKIEDTSLFPIIEHYDEQRNEDVCETRFIYYLTTEEKKKAARVGLEDLINTLPITLVNNRSIKQVEVLNTITGNSEKYISQIEEIDSNINQATVQVLCSFPRQLNYLVYSNDSLTLTAEVEDHNTLKLKESFGKTPNLFRDFPLIGSERFYFPFILNGKHFNPTEDRDGILLHSQDGTEAKENRKIVQEAVNAALMFSQWLIERNARNRYVCAFSRLPHEKWEDFSESWYKNLQVLWRKELASLPIVETAAENLQLLKNCRVPSYGLSNEIKTNFYSLTSSFIGKNQVPHPSLHLNWIEAIGPKDEIESWGVTLLYGLDNLLEDLQHLGNLYSLTEKLGDNLNAIDWLNQLYIFLSENKETDKLRDYAIIPNQHGNFLKIHELRLEDRSSPIPDEILDILLLIGDDWRKEIIHRRVISLNQNIETRSLSDASEAINAFLKDGRANLDFKTNNFIKRTDALSILKSIIRNIDASASGDDFRCKIFKCAKELFGFEENLHTVTNIDNFRFQTALQLFIHLLNEKIESCKNIHGLSEQLNKSHHEAIYWLNSYLSVIERKTDFKELLKHGNIVPNRKGHLRAYEDLKNFGTDDRPLDAKLITILKQLDDKQDWNEELVMPGIQLPLEGKKFDELGTCIVHTLREHEKEELVNPGSIKGFKTPILDLINWCESNKYLANEFMSHVVIRSSDLWLKFTMTDEVRDIVRDEDSIEVLKEIRAANLDKDDVKRVLKIASDLNNLGKDGLGSILEHAEDLLEREQHFTFMKDIGEKIEDVFREALESMNLHIIITYQGIGSQDFVLYNRDKPERRLLLEIKSYAHGTNAPFKFASSQIKESTINSENYYVCMIERPQKGISTSIDYIKSNLVYRSEVQNLMQSVMKDIHDLERIDRNSDSVRLVIDKRDQPRVHVDFLLLKQGAKSFHQLVEDIQAKIA